MKYAAIQQGLLTALGQGLASARYVRKISLFGSRLHGRERADSDVDLLIEFSRPVSFFDLAELQAHLGHALGIPVDLVTPRSLSKYFRSDVEKSAQMLYEQG